MYLQSYIELYLRAMFDEALGKWRQNLPDRGISN